MKNVFNRLKECVQRIFFLIITVGLVIPLPAFADRCDDANICSTCPVTKPRGGCLGPWGIKIKKDKESGIINNANSLATAINDYIKNNKPNSRFMELENPGMVFVNTGIKWDINPLILLGLANAETALATTGSSMECGNPWAQEPTANNPRCHSTDGRAWYEYNPTHKIDLLAVDDQAYRIKRVYVNNPKLRTFDDFIDQYLYHNPFNPLIKGVLTNKEDFKTKVKEPMRAILKVVRGALKCGGGNINPQSKEEWIEVFMQAEEITGVPWEFIAAITWNETSMGGNLGGCSYHAPPPDRGWVLTSGNGLRSQEDLEAFDNIVSMIDMPDNAPVSCNPSGSNGGAMGYTQVMPQEWEDKTEWMEQSQGHYPSPWNALDAVTVAGLILKDKAGIGLDEPLLEDLGVMLNAAGWYHGSGPSGSYASNAVATYLQIKLTGELP